MLIFLVCASVGGWGSRAAWAEQAGASSTGAQTPSTQAPEQGGGSGTSEADVARARTLFSEGVTLSDRGEHAQAAERFEAALALHVAPTIQYNLAATYAHLDRQAEAAALLDAMLADPSTTEELRGRGQTLLGELEPQIGSLTIDNEAIDQAARLTLDGQAVTADQLARPQRVSPGNHVVAATLDGEEIARIEVEVSAGASATATLEPPRPPVEAAITTPPTDDNDRPLVRDWRLWVGVGAGVAVVTVVAVVLGVTLGGREEYEDPVQGNMDPGVLTWP